MIEETRSNNPANDLSTRTDISRRSLRQHPGGHGNRPMSGAFHHALEERGRFSAAFRGSRLGDEDDLAGLGAANHGGEAVPGL